MRIWKAPRTEQGAGSQQNSDSDQFGAVFGLTIDLLLLVALRSLSAGEQHDDAEALPAQPPPAPPLTTALLGAQ